MVTVRATEQSQGHPSPRPPCQVPPARQGDVLAGSLDGDTDILVGGCDSACRAGAAGSRQEGGGCVFGAQGARRSRWPSSPRWSSRAPESPRCASAAWGCGGAGRARVPPSTAPLPVAWVAVFPKTSGLCAVRRAGCERGRGWARESAPRQACRPRIGSSPRLQPAPRRPHPPAAGTDERDAAAAPRELRPLSPARVTPQCALSPACPQVLPTSHPCGQSGERGDARPRSDPCRHCPAWQRLLARAGQRVRVGGHTATRRPLLDTGTPAPVFPGHGSAQWAATAGPGRPHPSLLQGPPEAGTPLPSITIRRLEPALEGRPVESPTGRHLPPHGTAPGAPGPGAGRPPGQCAGDLWPGEGASPDPRPPRNPVPLRPAPRQHGPGKATRRSGPAARGDEPELRAGRRSVTARTGCGRRLRLSA